MREGHILLIEDDKACQRLIKESIAGFHFYCAESVRDAKSLLFAHQKEIDAILIDIHLPDGDGLRLLHEVASGEKTAKIPCIVLSADNEISGKVMAFSSGAEDFISKPFDPIELNARVLARIKRAKRIKEDQSVIEVGNLLLDFHRQKVFLLSQTGKKEDLELTAKEFQLLSLLSQRLEAVFSREHILSIVWDNVSVSDRTIDSHVAHLRKKIERSNLQIETLKGMGYLARVRTSGMSKKDPMPKV